MFAGVELHVVRPAHLLQADAAISHLLLASSSQLASARPYSPEADSSDSSSCRPDLFPPELLHTVLDVYDTEPAELAVVLLHQDLDVVVGLLRCEVGQLGQQLRDEAVIVILQYCSCRPGWS